MGHHGVFRRSFILKILHFLREIFVGFLAGLIPGSLEEFISGYFSDVVAECLLLFLCGLFVNGFPRILLVLFSVFPQEFFFSSPSWDFFLFFSRIFREFSCRVSPGLFLEKSNGISLRKYTCCFRYVLKDLQGLSGTSS